MSEVKPSVTEGPRKPGDNPNLRNAKKRQGPRPKAKNSPNASTSSMNVRWIDPLPQVNVIHALGLEPNPCEPTAGEIDLDPSLPETIANPFCSLVESVSVRLTFDQGDIDNATSSLKALGYFKAAKQLYSTMLDHEKSMNQPLKAVYYDETGIPAHMSSALGMIGHMDTKVGKVLIRNASTLFKRWITKGLTIVDANAGTPAPIPDIFSLVWNDEDGLDLAKRLAREEIARITDLSYPFHNINVSIPRLTNQPLQQYHDDIHTAAPRSADLASLVSLLLMDKDDWRIGNMPNGHDLDTCLGIINLTLSGPDQEPGELRRRFEDFIALYVTRDKWRIESLVKTTPGPSGSTGYGAQTVSSTENTANWQFPISDGDVSLGYLFSPNVHCELRPKLIGYARRSKNAASADFAYQDAKEFAK